MAEFVCKVGDATGKVFQQVETAQSEAEARQKLSDRGLFVFSVRSHLGIFSQFSRSRRDRIVRGSDFLIFNQQFNTLIKAGLPILKALDLLAERAASPRLRPVLTDVRDRVREGAVLSDAFADAGVFSKVYTTALIAGEKSGNLPGVLDDFIAYQRVTSGVKKRLLAVLVYPAILVTVGTAILTYLVTFVVPRFAGLYHEMNVPLPWATQMLTTLTVGYRFWLIGAAVLIVVGIAGLFLWSRTAEGGIHVDRMKLRLPIVGDTWIKFQMAQFARTLATLLGGGTPLVPALQTASESIDSRLVSAAVSQAAEKVREGEPLHASLAATGLMPSLALEMVEVGEASGALAPMLNSVAQFYEEETSLRLQALISFVEPAVLLFMGLVVAFILIALYLPLFSFSVGSAGG
jgi:type IV pilus assembly protein PilC